MKRIKNFLFVEQSFTDIKETKQTVINIDFIDNITCKNIDQLGSVIVIETDNVQIMVKDDPTLFFSEFEDLISKYQDEW